MLLSVLWLPHRAAAGCVTGGQVFQKVTPAQSATFREYTIRLYRQDCSLPPQSHIAGVEILKSGRRVYAQTGYSFALGYPLAEDQPPDGVKPEVGMDFSGRGLPELLISEWSGGAHCCYTFHLFQLGDTFKKVQSIPLLDADESAFVRRSAIKGLVLSSVDYSDFAYFPSDFAGSPAGRIFLSFSAGQFRLNLSLMKSNPPTAAQIATCAAQFRQSRDWAGSQPLGMWYYATDLIYTGNLGEAWTFLDKAWGGGAADKKEYLGDYRWRFTQSSYHAQLKQLSLQTKLSAAGQRVDWTRQCYDYLHG